MAVGELFLSAFLQVLFDRLASPELLQFARQEGLRKQLDKWCKTLTRIRKVLDDAEEKQHTESTVKDWLDELRDLAYDVEDILDEFATEAALRRELMGESQASTSKVRNLVASWLTCLSPSAVENKISLRSKIKKITARFNDLVTQKDQLSLIENSTPRPSTREIPLSTSVVTEDHIYGREEVAEDLVQLLMSDKRSDALTKVNVVPIIGMGGIGKTTLAQLVYNDNKVQNFFDMKAWACVSEDFDLVRITKTILQSMSSENCDGKDLNWLQVKLKEQLCGKRFLVILDDVWNENYNNWIQLRAPFEAGAPGSSIIVTTRNQQVSSLMGAINIPHFQLELMSNDACLSLFSQHALDARDFSAHPNLKDIGEEIVRKCKGLPLAVKTIGGLLRRTQNCKDWEKVLNSKIWDIQIKNSGIVPALMLSYHHLPSYLKRCFAYCSILPKDYEFGEKEVVLLWMAEGLTQPREGEGEMEDLGSEYFSNLLSRSFFQHSRINKTRFQMHDLINDLAHSVAGNTCFRMEDRAGDSQQGNISTNARHSSYFGDQYDVAKKFEIFSKLTSLRTFLPLMLPSPGYCHLSHHVPLKLVPALRCLRVLSFNGYRITELSGSISDLKYLRYLDLSKTQISGLPESITTLYNLQTLLLENCTRLKKLPSMFQKLVNLRHLNINGANCLKQMPLQLGRLTCLQTLSNLVVGKENCSGIKELGPLKHLQGKLCISRLENVIEAEDAKDAELIRESKISALSLEWSQYIDESENRTSELDILNGLHPHNALTELVIRYYGGTKFSNWLITPSFPYMESLTLEYCYKCTSLPPFGQLPSLKFLLIRGMASVKKVGSEFCGNGLAQCFRSLETLHFSDMKEWENWSPCEEFLNLRELSLKSCPKLLGKLPNKLPLLNQVEIYDCGLLEAPFSCFPDLCKLKIEKSEGVACGKKATFKSVTFSGSLPPISDQLTQLEKLTIDSCEELTNLWSDNLGSLPHLPSLYDLRISNCPKLVSLVAEEVDQIHLQLGMPSAITHIRIQNCVALESLPKGLMYNNKYLESIVIHGCDSLTHFARSQLPPTLKLLHISDCKSMRNLLEDDINNNSTCNTSLLQVLKIRSCSSLESLTSSGELPATLQSLCINSCPKLAALAKSFGHNSFLEEIRIYHCENLQFLNGGELLLPSNLRELFISDCEKMKALQNKIHNLTSLRDLTIRNCPSISSYLKEGFPTNLTKLQISHLKVTEGLFDWGLDNLTFLNELYIGGYQHLVSFPEMTLPSSLTILRISNLSNLECVSSKGLRKVTCLKTLSIYNCEKLTCFPEDGLPPSLLKLNIFGCQKLRYFPKNGLPPLLGQLYIDECPLLKESCKKDQGREWLKIVEIPCVRIDMKYIHESEE